MHILWREVRAPPLSLWEGSENRHCSRVLFFAAFLYLVLEEGIERVLPRTTYVNKFH